MLFLAAALASSPPSANTEVAEGPWTVIGQTGYARHTHGGATAKLSQARFQVALTGEESLPLTVERIRYLTGHSCDEVPSTVRSEPEFGGLITEGMEKSATVLTLKPGTHDVVVGLHAVEAYYSYCDRFAFEITFTAGAYTLSAIAETQVIRMEPQKLPELPGPAR